MRCRRIRVAIFTAALTTIVFAAPVMAAGEAYGSLSDDWTWQVQDWLTHAATKSPKWQSQRGTIERHIENIGYLLRSASLAIRTADYAVAGINLRHAVKMLERGVDRGFYRRSDVEPLKRIITQQLPGIARYNIEPVQQEGR